MPLSFVPSRTRAHPHESPLWLVVAPEGLLVRVEDGTARPPSDPELAGLGIQTEGAAWIGSIDGHDCAALALPPACPLPDGFQLRNIRSLFGVWPDGRVLAAAVGAEVLEFESTHAFCGRCGTRTSPESKERARRCPACGLVSYPRISPAVIVLVRRGREALLARSARFPAAFYSTLAGFVEVGESLEETVAREIREEVGISVDELRYFGSQPWPFPHSLMLAFVARYAGGEVCVDGEEIVEARWFAPEALPAIPPPLSIARQLIDAWVAETR